MLCLSNLLSFFISYFSLNACSLCFSPLFLTHSKSHFLSLSLLYAFWWLYPFEAHIPAECCISTHSPICNFMLLSLLPLCLMTFRRADIDPRYYSEWVRLRHTINEKERVDDPCYYRRGATPESLSYCYTELISTPGGVEDANVWTCWANINCALPSQ